MRFKLGLLIGFGIGWLAGKDVLMTFFQGLRKPGGASTSPLSGTSTAASNARGTGTTPTSGTARASA